MVIALISVIRFIMEVTVIMIIKLIRSRYITPSNTVFTYLVYVHTPARVKPHIPVRTYNPYSPAYV